MTSSPRKGSPDRSRRRSGAVGIVSGLTSVGSGVIAAGICTYGFLSITGRELGPSQFAPVSTLWALVFIVGPGLFLPVQQELGRVLARHRLERTGGWAVRRAATLSSGIALVVAAASLAASPWLTHELFAGDWALFGCFELAVFAYAATFFTRGVLSGLGEFRSLGRLITVEAFSRLVIAAALALFNVDAVGWYGLAIGVAPFISVTVVTRAGRRLRLDPGSHVPWSEFTRAFGWLLVGSLMAQFLANAGPIAVQLLAPRTESAEAGRFLNALIIARLTFYLFQAVQATILPNVSALVAARRFREVRAGVHRVVAACGLLVALSTVSAALFGPFAVRVLFGSGFEVGRTTMVLLTSASAVYVFASALSGVAIALAGHILNAIAWAGGALAFVAATSFGSDLFSRVEVGYLLGAFVSAAALLAGVLAVTTRGGTRAKHWWTPATSSGGVTT